MSTCNNISFRFILLIFIVGLSFGFLISFFNGGYLLVVTTPTPSSTITNSPATLTSSNPTTVSRSPIIHHHSDHHLHHHHHDYALLQKDYRFLFLGDSNTLGMTMVPQYGWQKLGGYPKVLLEKRKSMLRKLMKSNENSFSSLLRNKDSKCPISIADYKNDPPTIFKKIPKPPPATTPRQNQNKNNVNNKNSNFRRPFTSKVWELHAPRSVFAVGTSGLSGVGGAVRFVQSKEFAVDFRETIRNISSSSTTKTKTQKKLIIFIMFGTNDALKKNTNASMETDFIYRKYKSFVQEEIIDFVIENTKNAAGAVKIERIVFITPPRTLSNCSFFAPFCYLTDLDILEHRVVPVIRKIAAEFSSSSSSSLSSVERKNAGITFQLIDFYDFLTKETIAQKNTNTNNQKSNNDDDVAALGRKYYQSDGVHLNANGHRVLGELVWTNVSKAMMSEKNC